MNIEVGHRWDKIVSWMNAFRRNDPRHPSAFIARMRFRFYGVPTAMLIAAALVPLVYETFLTDAFDNSSPLFRTYQGYYAGVLAFGLAGWVYATSVYHRHIDRKLELSQLISRQMIDLACELSNALKGVERSIVYEDEHKPGSGGHTMTPSEATLDATGNRPPGIGMWDLMVFRGRKYEELYPKRHRNSAVSCDKFTKEDVAALDKIHEEWRSRYWMVPSWKQIRFEIALRHAHFEIMGRRAEPPAPVLVQSLLHEIQIALWQFTDQATALRTILLK